VQQASADRCFFDASQANWFLNLGPDGLNQAMAYKLSISEAAVLIMKCLFLAFAKDDLGNVSAVAVQLGWNDLHNKKRRLLGFHCCQLQACVVK